jgi:hypothetical protein
MGRKVIRTGVPPFVAVVNCSLSLGFPFIACIYVANQVVTDIVAYLKETC